MLIQKIAIITKILKQKNFQCYEGSFAASIDTSKAQILVQLLLGWKQIKIMNKIDYSFRLKISKIYISPD